MRIIALRFKNLNSLVGEWKIDLSSPTFSDDGIFAITGPTGSGKSTILDAICLALYGRTPRLNKVNKSTNEIMSRQSGECFAEVCFETQSDGQIKHFKCFWSQHRAGKKAQGKLQNPKHEISNADSGEILEEKLSAVAQRIIQISGMDFERFTRSMMLAQGGFAAFLEADADDRAPILEQITGTEIYSHISMKVHELRLIEQKKLETLQAEMSGMELLSHEDEKSLVSSLSFKQVEEEKLLDLHKTTHQLIQWRSIINHCKQEQEKLLLRQQLLDQQRQDFIPKQVLLDGARKALSLAGNYAQLNSSRHEQESDRKRLKDYQHSLTTQQAEFNNAEAHQKTALERLEQQKVLNKEAMETIRQVRALDLSLKEKDIPIKAAEQKLIEIETTLKICEKKIIHNSQTLEKNTHQKQVLNDIIKTSQCDESLVEELTGINAQIDVLYNLDQQQQNKQQELIEHEEQYRKDNVFYTEQIVILTNKKNKLNELEQTFNATQQTLTTLLENKEVSQWRNELGEYKDQQVLLKDLISQNNTFEEYNKEEEAYQKQSIEFNNEQKKYEIELEKLIPTIASLEREIRLLEENIALQNKILALDEERKNLQDDEDCPLCGAKDHPYARGNIPDSNKTRIEFDEVKKTLSVQLSRRSDLQLMLVANRKEVELCDKQSKQRRGKITYLSQQILDLMTRLENASVLFEKNNSEILQQRLEENKQHIDCYSDTLATIDKVEKQSLNYKNSMDLLKEELNPLELQHKTIEQQQLAIEKSIERLKQELDKLLETLKVHLKHLQNKMLQFNIEHFSLASLDSIKELLTQRRQQWLKNQQQINTLEQSIGQLQLELKHQNQIQIKLSDDIREQQVQLTTLRQVQTAVSVQRQSLFADKSTDIEAEKLSTAFDNAEKSLQQATQVFALASQELLQLKTNIDLTDKDISLRDIKLKDAEESFKIRCQQLDFESEETYTLACLSEEKVDDLKQQEQQLITQQTELAVKARDNNTQLDHEQKKQLTDQAIEELQLDAVQMEQQLRELQGELGAVKQRLENNEALKKTQQSRAELIAKQKKECSRWDLLHHLIGSADGKKYRNFAQGLTFEMMVGHANQQLKKMTQRYLLIRDNQQPLELNVVDNFQAGEIRSTKNLSGGESFIVSLSLALGLSHMASKNVRVDSLFLDEGFGTLDEEALDTALETLSGLQQEGKLIGVISHVQALKDRISTQILVNPLSGGRSEISGQGCFRIA